MQQSSSTIPDLSINVGYFDTEAPVVFLSGALPHWRQDNVTCFVTFRLADSLPREKLQQWLDAGTGSCVLALPEVKQLVENALGHFDGQRYTLDAFVVAPNHVHALVTPKTGHALSEILRSWKSFTAHEIVKAETASRRLQESQSKSRDGSATLRVWQKESFDHIVRNPASLEKFRAYIRAHDVSPPESMSKPRKSTIEVQGTAITVLTAKDEDFISLTDMLKAKDGESFISDWLRNRNTVEFLGIWESVYKPNFNSVEFDGIKMETLTGTNAPRRLDAPKGSHE